MIYQVSGDILLSQAQLIAHGIAANDPMNQGLALSLHQKYPSMHKDFHHWCHQYHPKSGAAWLWGGPNSVRIVNLITQECRPGKGAKPGKATLKHIRESLKELTKIIEKENFNSISLPRIATGVGGLEWDDVFPVVESVLSDLDIPIYLYTDYQPGKQAKEPAHK
ncbi:MAG: macro domain-containing protein [Candidatus Endonucleobacter sp. (ex Gigantidas childressi)]|nr:macro domain-containing protein [Candidatus Endonucleobacter sp. (ex Gigantidas childressi)]